MKPVRRQRSRLPPTIVSTVSATASNLRRRAASSSAAFRPLSLWTVVLEHLRAWRCCARSPRCRRWRGEEMPNHSPNFSAAAPTARSPCQWNSRCSAVGRQHQRQARGLAEHDRGRCRPSRRRRARRAPGRRRSKAAVLRPWSSRRRRRRRYSGTPGRAGAASRGAEVLDVVAAFHAHRASVARPGRSVEVDPFAGFALVAWPVHCQRRTGAEENDDCRKKCVEIRTAAPSPGRKNACDKRGKAVPLSVGGT